MKEFFLRTDIWSQHGKLKCKPCFGPFISQNPQKSVPLFSVCCEAWPHKRPPSSTATYAVPHPPPAISSSAWSWSVSTVLPGLSHPFSIKGLFIHFSFLVKSHVSLLLSPAFSMLTWLNIVTTAFFFVFAAFETPFKTKFRTSQAQRVLRF